jgi:hypothetical protein
MGMETDFQKVRALMAFSKMPRSLHSDVLADGTIAERFHIDVSRPTQLSDDNIIDSKVLFAAFRNAADGKPPTAIVNQAGVLLDAKLRIAPDGAGVIEIDTRGWRFAHSALLASDPTRRIAALDAALTQHTLCRRDAAELRDRVARSQYSDDDFGHALRVLASSPESFSAKLRATLAVRQVGEEDLLPEDVRLWEHLTAPIEGSPTLAIFTGNELASERIARIASDPVRAFETISLTCSAPDLVPKAMLRSLDTETVLHVVESALAFHDHFALVAAFEICADRVETDVRFVALGDQLLDRLVKDFAWLKNACGLFATVFVVATARLALHEVLRERPVYWRRLAAASLASLIVRTCGVGETEPKELMSWAIHTCGEEYFLSVYNDMAAEPQWRPEWADTRFMAADAFGRLHGAFLAVPAQASPATWRERIEAAKIRTDEDGLNLFITFPAVLQGERRTPRPTLEQLGEQIGGAYRELQTAPSVDKLLCLTPAIHAYGVPDGINGAVQKLVESIGNSHGDIDEEAVQPTLIMACHIAAMTNDPNLADTIADTAIELILREEEPSLVQQMFFRLVETGTANPDRDPARSALARRLEFVALRLPASEAIVEFFNLLRALRSVEPKMAPLLGRAVAAAKLAALRAKAA